MAENSITQIKNFFAQGDIPVTGPEFRDFWASLTDEEKDYYKNADLG